MVIEGYSYRTSSRFGSRVMINIKEDEVQITGPRIKRTPYQTWIYMQVFLLFLCIPAILFPFLYGAPAWAFLSIAVLLVHQGVGALGAAALWEMENLIAFGKGLKGETVFFKRTDAKDIRIGTGWARGILWLAIPHFIPLVNFSAKGHCVSFVIKEQEKRQVFALHIAKTEEAKRFYEFLSKK